VELGGSLGGEWAGRRRCSCGPRHRPGRHHSERQDSTVLPSVDRYERRGRQRRK